MVVLGVLVRFFFFFVWDSFYVQTAILHGSCFIAVPIRDEDGVVRRQKCIMHIIFRFAGALNWAKIPCRQCIYSHTLSFSNVERVFPFFFLSMRFGFIRVVNSFERIAVFLRPRMCVYFMKCYLKIICTFSMSLLLRLWKLYQVMWFIWIGCTQYDTELNSKHNSSWWLLSDVFHPKHVVGVRHAWAHS